MAKAQEIQEYTEFKTLKRVSFRRTAERLLEIKAEEARLKAEKATLTGEIGVALTLAGAQSVGFGDFLLVRQQTSSSAKLDKGKMVKMLINEGVDPELVNRVITESTTPATVTGETVAVRARGKKEEV